TDLNFRCCTASGEICRRRLSTKVIAFGCTSHLAANGFHTSCGGWQNARRTCCSSRAGSLARVGNRLLRNEQSASIDLMRRRRVLLPRAFAQSLLRWASPQVLSRSTLNLRRLLPARLLKSPEPQFG